MLEKTFRIDTGLVDFCSFPYWSGYKTPIQILFLKKDL
jgi:hypothetical protein